MVDSKDWIIILIGTIISVVVSVLPIEYIRSQIPTISPLIGLLYLMILGVSWIFYKRIRESEDKLDRQEKERKRIEEKLKIYEQLIEMRADIKALQMRGNKK